MCHPPRFPDATPRKWSVPARLAVLFLALGSFVLRADNPLLGTQPDLTLDNAPVDESITVDVGDTGVDLESTETGTWEYQFEGDATWSTFDPTIPFPDPIEEGETFTIVIKFTDPSGACWHGELVIRTGYGDGTSRHDDMLTDDGADPEPSGCCASGPCSESECSSECDGSPDDEPYPEPDPDSGSLREHISLPVDPNEPDFEEGGLLLYRSRLGATNVGSIDTLRYVGLPTVEILAESDAPADSSLEYTCSIRQVSGFSVAFGIPNGETVGRPTGPYIHSGSRIELLDGISGNVVGDPANATHVRQYRQNGGVVVFEKSTGEPKLYTARTGRITQLPALKVQLYEDGGQLAQVKTAAGLLVLDEVDSREYTVKRYLPHQISGSSAPYTTTGDPNLTVTVKHPAATGQVEVTRETDGRKVLNLWKYSIEATYHEWKVTRMLWDDGSWEPAWSKARRDGSSQGSPMIKRLWASPDGSIFYTGEISTEGQDWGARAGTSSTATDGSRSIDFFSDSSNPGSYGKLSEKTDSNGLKEEYEYDSDGRMTLRKSEWLGQSGSKHEVFSYSPHVTGETLRLNDYRPRTTEVKVEGGTKTISKTMFAAYTDSGGEYTEITKRAVLPGAGWSDSSNLVTTRTYYPGSEPSTARGRLKEVVRPDGDVTAYNYSYGSDPAAALTTTVERELDGSGPIEGRSTREEIVRDALGRIRQVTRGVYVSGAWLDYEKTTHDFSNGTNGPRGYRYRTTVEDLVGSNVRTVATYDWSGGRLMSRTDEAGTETSYDYDAFGRRFKTTREAVAASGNFPAQPAVTTTVASSTPVRRGNRIEFRDRDTEIVAGSLKLFTSVSRDGRGRITARTDENGYTTSYAYTLNGREVTVTRPDGETEITLRHKDGRLDSITGTGVVDSYSSYAVDGTGKITETRRSATSDNVRYVATTTDMLGQTVSAEQPSRDGGTATTTVVDRYHETGTGELERVTSNAADVPHRLRWESTDGTKTRSVISTNISIDLDDDRISETETSFESSGGELWRVTENFVYPEDASSTRKAVSTRKTLLGGFDAGPDEIARSEHIDELSGKTTVVSRTLAAGVLTETTDHPETTRDSATVSYHGRLMETTAPGAGTTVHGRDGLGRQTSSDDPRTGTVSVTYHDHPDKAGFTTRLVDTRTDAANNSTSYAYGAQDAHGAGRVTSVTRPDSSVANTSYTARGEILARWGAGTYARLHFYNAYGEMTEMRTYKGLSHGTEPTPATSGGAATEWSYDAATGLLLAKRDADNKGADYAYDPAGRLKTRKWARTDPGQSARVETGYTYTPWGELDVVHYSYESEDTPDLNYNYDRLGRVEQVTQGAATVHEYDYDSTTLALETETFRYDLDRDGTVDHVRRLDRHRDSHLRPTGYEFGTENFTAADVAAGYGYESAAGRIDGVWHAPSFTAGIPDGAPDFDYSYRYEISGSLHVGTDAAVGGGVADSGLLFHTSGPGHDVRNRYDSDRNALVRKENLEKTGNHFWSDYTYQVNSLGQRTKLTLGVDPVADGNGVTTTAVEWDYNARDELVEADHDTAANKRAYKYDAIGNRKETVAGTVTLTGTDDYAANSVNEYTKVEGSDLPAAAYDDDGNLLDDGVLEYFWNAENRLVRVEDGGDVIAEYTYDYRGRRIAKTTTSDAPQGAGNRVFFYDGWNLIAEYADDPWTPLALHFSYTWGLDLSQSRRGAGGVGGLLVVEKHSSGATGIYYPTYDGNGNVSEYLDASGDRVAHYQYDPFGNLTPESTGSHQTLFTHRFSTKYFDEETGFYYYGYRYLDPVTGRWPSRDPIGERGGLNLYGFVGNDGMNKWDLLGLEGAVTSHEVKTCEIYIYIGHSVSGKPMTWSIPDEEKEGTCYYAYALSCRPQENNESLPDEVCPPQVPTHNERLYLHPGKGSETSGKVNNLDPDLPNDDNRYPDIVKRVLSDENKNKMIGVLCDESDCCCEKVRLRIRVQHETKWVNDFDGIVDKLEKGGYGGIKKAYNDEKEFVIEYDCKKYNAGQPSESYP
jgi:RHS repeat-associated protein